MEIISRKSAREAGLKRFFSNKPCPNGHNVERLVSNGTCIQCSKIRVKNHWTKTKKRIDILSKKEAIELGEKDFFTGRQCSKGHNAQRRVSDGKCRDCIKINNKEKNSRRKEYIKEKIKNWKSKNKDKARVYNHTRRIRVLSTNGFSLKDVKIILHLQRYMCANCECDISESYHIDHIMPLALGGTNERTNIQCLCPSCNLRKGSKHPIDWARQNGRLI